jgi:hypothetical protein
MQTRDLLAGRLVQLFERGASEDWPWCEETVTYDNAKLALGFSPAVRLDA